MTPRYECVVLTGATGAIGSHLLERLEQSDCRSIVAVFSREASYARFVSVRRALSSKVVPVVADLRDDDSAAALASAIRGLGPALFIHAAADVSWTKSFATLRDLNVDGPVRVARVAAEHAPGKSALIMFSTAYAHRSTGALLNAYEETKRAAENAVLDAYGDRLKIGIVRPSLVVGETGTGRISRFNGLYPLVRVIAFRELPCIVGDPDYAVDLIPVDWVGDETIALANRLPDAGEPIVATLAAQDQAIALGALVSLVHERVNLRMAEWRQTPRPAVSIIKQRQFDFLMRAAPSWDLEERFEQITRISEIMAGYLGHSQERSALRRENTLFPFPDRSEYLSAAIDYWVDQHRARLVRERIPSWAQ
jgi:nucleoside-diphosphate-sugar epimerase